MHVFELAQLGGKQGLEVDQPGQVDGLVWQLPLAHERHDDRATDQIVACECQAPHHRKVPLVKQVGILFQGLGVLAVGRADATDRGHAQSNQVAIGLRAVALEVAVQTPLPFGHGQSVARQSKVVHADVDIARIGQGVERAREHGHLGRTCRQLLRVNAALRLEAFGQMRIGIQGNAIWPQTLDLLQRAVKGLRRLQGQAIDQIDVDRLKTQAARRLHQSKHLLCRLDAVHGFLHGGVKVLHAKTQAVETQLGQNGQAAFVHGARVHLNGVFTARHEFKVRAQQGHELPQLLVAHEGGRAAAQMQLADRLPEPQMPGVQRDLFAEICQIIRSPLFVLGDDFVAGTVVAQRLAKRNVHIQRQRWLFAHRARLALHQRLHVIGFAKGFNKTVCSGVGGVARAGHVKACQQLRRDNGHVSALSCECVQKKASLCPLASAHALT